MLSLLSITRSFGPTLALDEVSIEFAGGEVHVLLGENGAGKSTLMNVAYGLLQPDAGRIEIGGKPVHFRSPSEARRAGIGMVHQEFSLIDNLAVWENLALALGEPGALRLDRARIEKAAADLSARTGLDIGALDARTGDLAVGVRQRIEILKALAGDTRVVILDEPTAVLTPSETEQLFAVLDRLRRRGAAVIFITHKLAEVMAVADRISVLRRGRLVATRARGEVGPAELAEMMVGSPRAAESGAAAAPRQGGPRSSGGAPARLDVRGLCACEPGRPPRLEDVTFSVGAGEVFAVAGVDGNGQDELFEALVGLRRAAAGAVLVDGADVTHASVRERLRASVSWVPPDRQRQGLLRGAGVRENLMLNEAVLQEVRSGPFLSLPLSRALAARLVSEYDIRIAGLEAPAASLSGGNQQRLIVARSLVTSPAVLIAFNPTRGLDIAATRAVYDAFRGAARRGTAIVLISTDLDEVLELSDRVAVLYRGRLSEPMPCPVPVERLGRLMAGAA